ncbi:unnamed protein product [Pleuronectes platessa]|uniref:Uncharacterized protein n=1 Tax=Pleuronectes platessa TaxID=8262 RepID=A0A9N7U867_PLEPL|nr:unnamed protein product [Pleuronectes platessa]
MGRSSGGRRGGGGGEGGGRKSHGGIKNGMEQNKPEYKELFCVFGGAAQSSLLISDLGYRSPPFFPGDLFTVSEPRYLGWHMDGEKVLNTGVSVCATADEDDDDDDERLIQWILHETNLPSIRREQVLHWQGQAAASQESSPGPSQAIESSLTSPCFSTDAQCISLSPSSEDEAFSLDMMNGCYVH